MERFMRRRWRFCGSRKIEKQIARGARNDEVLVLGGATEMPRSKIALQNGAISSETVA